MMTIRKSRFSAGASSAAILLGVVLLAGCGGDSTSTDPPLQCPAQGTALRWETFGQQFFASYCVDCHSTMNVGSARNGAPDGLNWDSLDAVRMFKDRVAHEAAGNHEDMPPPGITHVPSHAEREQLAEWIACGAPSGP